MEQLNENKVFEKAIEAAKQVEPLKSSYQVMQIMWEIMKELKEDPIPGDVLEIGCKKGKTTVFLAELMSEMFPDKKLYSFDPFTLDGAKKSLKSEADEIDFIYTIFKKHTNKYKNHIHYRQSSKRLTEFLGEDIFMMSFIDGEHSFDAVWKDFENVYHMTKSGGIIAIDDYQNGAWPGVVKAYKMIIDGYGDLITVINKTPKTVFLRVNKIG